MPAVLNLHLAKYVPESPKGPYIELFLSSELAGHVTSQRFYKRDMPKFWAELFRKATNLGLVEDAEERIRQRAIDAAKLPRGRKLPGRATIQINLDLSGLKINPSESSK